MRSARTPIHTRTKADKVPILTSSPANPIGKMPASALAGILPIGLAGELVSIGTLSAFVLVCIGVLALRIRQPELPRAFRTPAIYLVAPMGALSALFLMSGLPADTWIRLVLW